MLVFLSFYHSMKIYLIIVIIIITKKSKLKASTFHYLRKTYRPYLFLCRVSINRHSKFKICFHMIDSNIIFFNWTSLCNSSLLCRIKYCLLRWSNSKKSCFKTFANFQCGLIISDKEWEMIHYKTRNFENLIKLF